MPRTRRATVLALLAAVALAGCLSLPSGDGGGSARPAEGPGNAPVEDDPEDRRDGTAGADGDGEGNGTAAQPGNGTGDEGADTGPNLPENVTVADATVVERTERRAAFHWNGTLPRSPPPDGEERSRLLTVPPDRWLKIQVNATWDEPRSDLEVTVEGEGLSWCARDPSLTTVDTTTSTGCTLRPQPREDWSSWTVGVRHDPTGNPALEGPYRDVPFDVHLTVTALEEPWGDLPDASAPDGWPDPEDAAIRPGVKVRADGQCTTNFVFRSPDNASLYIGTAAHCAEGAGIGAMPTIGGTPHAGRLVYCSWGTMTANGTRPCPDVEDPGAPEWDNDFALIEVRPDLRDEVHPALRYWGGPTGLEPSPTQGDRVLTYGNTTLRDANRPVPDAVDPDRGHVVDSSRWMTSVAVSPSRAPGDSGSPFLTGDGKALGVLRLGLRCVDDTFSQEAVTNLAPGLGFLRNETSLDVELVTWPLLREPTVPPNPLTEEPPGAACQLS